MHYEVVSLVPACPSRTQNRKRAQSFSLESYKQHLEIEIARRWNGRVDRPGLDDDNATSLKHGNEAFLDYMLDSVFVGSK